MENAKVDCLEYLLRVRI